MVKLCIFDVDGTIVDTIDDITDSTNRALQKFGYSCIDTSKCKELLGGNALSVTKGLFEKKEAGDEEFINNFMKYYLDDYNDNLLVKTKPFDGVVETLKELKKSGVKLCVVSNKPNRFSIPILNRYFSDIDFEYIIGADSDFENKPSPDGVNYVMRKLNVSPEETVYIGDSEVDIKTGKNAKVKTIGVSWGFRGKDALKKVGADYLIDSPKEIKRIVYDKRKNRRVS